MRSSSLKGRLTLATLVCLGTLPLSAIQAHAQSVIATIPLVNSPAGVDVNPIANKAYVAVQSGVEVINETTNQVVRTFNLPTEWTITDVKVNPITSRIYVATQAGGLYVVDPKTYFPIAFVNANAASLAINPTTNKIYASDFEGMLYVVDGATNNIDASISIPALQNVAVNILTNRIYAAQELFPGQVAVIDGKTNQVITSVTGGGDLFFDVAVDPLHNTFYATDAFGSVSVFDGATNTFKTSISLPGQPAGISVDPITRKVYASVLATNQLAVINGNNNQLTNTIQLGVSPEYSAIDILRGRLYVGNMGQPDVPSTETLSVVKTR